MTDERYLADRFEWAAPGDNQEDCWRVFFHDRDCGEMIFTGPDAEQQAWATWNRYAQSFNINVFRQARLRDDVTAKLACVISHATGGATSDTSLSLNEIGVRITALRNKIYEAGKAFLRKKIDGGAAAKYWFEIGFASCWAEALVRNGDTAPFPLTDAELDRAWTIRDEGYDGDRQADIAAIIGEPDASIAAADYVSLLAEARDLFREYQAHHLAKVGEAGRSEKAERNRDIADRIDAVLGAWSE